MTPAQSLNVSPTWVRNSVSGNLLLRLPISASGEISLALSLTRVSCPEDRLIVYSPPHGGFACQSSALYSIYRVVPNPWNHL
ncbi:hypothetical protein TNCV_3198721 [Trichonephila clavipes]|nr:hypothetical protein TNCV_3198721 [Trichonephila clavipes]